MGHRASAILDEAGLFSRRFLMSYLRTAATVAFLLLLAPAAQAEYATPGIGVDWTLDDLVANSGGAVTGGGGVYEVYDAVVVSLSDRLTVAAGTHITFIDEGGTVGLEINGALSAVGTADAPIVFTAATPTPGAWRGLDYRDTGGGSEFHLAFCVIAYADEAIDVYGADVLLENCEVHSSLDKVLDISAGDGEIRGCTFHDNRRRTITLNLSASPLIADCTLEDNNLDNASPYPFINIGLQGVNSPTVRGCTIRGGGNYMSGGIAIWNACNGLIEDNLIQDCGYGILCYQTGASPTIRDNTITENNTHPDTVNWGFGIACNGENAPIVVENHITHHWYGVATINGGQPNLGDLINDFPGDDGANLIYDNGLDDEIYGFYNNTPLPQMAQGNWWGTADAQGVEDAIYHQIDDPSLGLVNYDLWLTDITPVGEDRLPAKTVLTGVSAHPNPFNPQVAITFSLARERHVAVNVLDVAGRVLAELHAGVLPAGEHRFTWAGTDRNGRPVASGTYFYRIVAGAEARAGKLVLVK
jgi:parallel beta-helix repeat protein